MFSCEYCPQKFSTKDERLTHTASHFVTQLCKDCNKILIRINDEWYGLHDICSKTEPDDLDFQNDTHFGEATEYHDEFIEDGADEVFNEPPPVQPIKQEIKSEHLSPNQQLQQPPRISPLSQNLAAKQNAGGQKVSSRRQNTKKKKQSSPKPAKRKIENQIKTTKRFKVSNKVWTDHRPAGTVTCDICNKVLRSFSTIGAHMKNLHSGKERVRCDECGESFSNVKEHKRVHLKYKAFVCSYCGKGFNHLRNLKEHAHMHTNEKPYDCKVCNKKFSRKTYLSSHSRTHTGNNLGISKIL